MPRWFKNAFWVSIGLFVVISAVVVYLLYALRGSRAPLFSADAGRAVAEAALTYLG